MQWHFIVRSDIYIKKFVYDFEEKNAITHYFQNVDVCLKGFFRRHPSISQRLAELTSAARPEASIVPHITRFCTLLWGLLESRKESLCFFTAQMRLV